MKLEIRDEAGDDLEDIFDYISKDPAATQTIRRLRDRMATNVTCCANGLWYPSSHMWVTRVSTEDDHERTATVDGDARDSHVTSERR
jgi:hypothetical protein